MDYNSYSKEELIGLLGEKDKSIKHMKSTYGSSFSENFKSKERSKFGDTIDWLEHSPVCTKIVDLDFNLQYMSRAGIEGLQVDDVTNYYGSPYPFHFFPEKFKIKMIAALEKVKETKEMGQVVDEPLSDIHGQLHCFNATLIPVFKNDSELDYIIVVSINVSDMKAAEKEKIELQRTYFHNSKLASLGEIAAGVGHEINNPLAIAMGFVKKLKKDSTIQEDSPLIKSFSHIDEAHSRIATIVKQLKTYARVDSTEIEPFCVGSNIKQVTMMLKDIYTKEDIHFSMINLDEEVLCMGNSGRFQQVMMNLFTNARDAMVDAKMKNIIIELRKESESKASILVSDTGKGIPKDIQEKVFEPFFTTKEIGEGTGMGLGIVLSLIKEIGGELSMNSQINIGTQFKLEFPICSEES